RKRFFTPVIKGGIIFRRKNQQKSKQYQLKIEHTYLKGCFLIHPTIYKDGRGTFHETFNLKEIKNKTGLDIHFVQDNQSVSKKGVLRGFHFQNGEYAQSKLVRVVKGVA